MARDDYRDDRDWNERRYARERDDRDRGRGRRYARERDERGMYGRGRGGNVGGRYDRDFGFEDDQRRNYRGEYDDDYGYDQGPDRGDYPGDFYNWGVGAFGPGFAGGVGAGMGYPRPFGGPVRGSNYRAYDETGATMDDDIPPYARGYREAGPHAGRGPKGYRRSDERIVEDVSENLTENAHVDASNIQVASENGEVTLEGTVDSRRAKRMAEELAEYVRGVHDVHNRLRIERPEDQTDTTRM